MVMDNAYENYLMAKLQDVDITKRTVAVSVCNDVRILSLLLLDEHQVSLKDQIMLRIVALTVNPPKKRKKSNGEGRVEGKPDGSPEDQKQ